MTGFIITARVDNLHDAIDLYGNLLSTHCTNPGKAELAFEIRETTKIISSDDLKTNGQRNVGKNPPLHVIQ